MWNNDMGSNNMHDINGSSTASHIIGIGVSLVRENQENWFRQPNLLVTPELNVVCINKWLPSLYTEYLLISVAILANMEYL